MWGEGQADRAGRVFLAEGSRKTKEQDICISALAEGYAAEKMEVRRDRQTVRAWAASSTHPDRKEWEK